jgi:glycosyltransferase involved in cell wall biosynthesis
VRFLAPPPHTPVEPASPPSFSIAIGAYQAVDTIGEAIESALAQTVPAREIVVCDDGSTDGTADVAARYDVHVIRAEHGGATVAKTRAAEATTADFVAFLDADDVYYPERLAALGELAAERPDLDVLTTNADLDVDGTIAGRYYPDIARFPVEDQAAGIIANDSAVLGTAAVRRSAFFAAGGLRPGVDNGYDWELWIKLAVRGSLFGCVDEPLYCYRVHERGASADLRRGWRDAVDLLEHVLATERPNDHVHAALERSLAYHRRGAALVEAEAALRNGEPGARALARTIAGDGTHSPATRAKAAFAFAAPGAARRLLELRERRTGRSRLRKPIPGR